MINESNSKVLKILGEFFIESFVLVFYGKFFVGRAFVGKFRLCIYAYVYVCVCI